MSILLADKVVINDHLTPKQTVNHLIHISQQYGYAYNPLQSQQMGQATRNIFKILINNHIYRIVWHNDKLISIWVVEYGFDTEIKHWPKLQDTDY